MGITLVELMVVTAVIGILLAIAIPAVQLARESGRRSQCQNNLRQVGLAFQSHEVATRFYPPGFVLKPRRHNFVQFILPYFEQSSIEKEYDFKFDWDSVTNHSAVRHDLKLLRCPSAPGGRRFISDYAVCTQVNPDTAAKLIAQKLMEKRRSDYTGFLGDNRRTSAYASDGQSTTILLTEDAGRPIRYALGFYKGDRRLTGARWATPGGRFDINLVCEGREFGVGGQLINCTNNNEIFSFHPGGANFLVMDGSVRFIEQGIDSDEITSLITARAGD